MEELVYLYAYYRDGLKYANRNNDIIFTEINVVGAKISRYHNSHN